MRSPVSPYKATLQYLVAVLSRLLLEGEEKESTLLLAISTARAVGTDAKSGLVSSGADSMQYLDRFTLPPKLQTQSLLDAFFSGPNRMVFVCDPSVSQMQFDELYHSPTTISHESFCLLLLPLFAPLTLSPCPSPGKPLQPTLYFS